MNELSQLLNRHPLSRKVFRELALVELQLYRDGYRCLSAMPLDIVGAALEQLDLVLPRCRGNHAALRSKLQIPYAERQFSIQELENMQPDAGFDAPDRLQVEDATESAFLQAEAEWFHVRSVSGIEPPGAEEARPAADHQIDPKKNERVIETSLSSSHRSAT